MATRQMVVAVPPNRSTSFYFCVTMATSQMVVVVPPNLSTSFYFCVTMATSQMVVAVSPNLSTSFYFCVMMATSQMVVVVPPNLSTSFCFCVSMHRSTSLIKHQLDATLCRFYFCRVTLHVSGAKGPSSGVLKNWYGGPCIVAGRSSHHHIRGETAVSPLICGRRTSFLILLMMDP